jgi:beta-lactam-binding protein with PASTA domain
VVWLLTKDNGSKKTVAVPPVTNLPQAQAQAVLSATGFKVGVQNQAVGISSLVGIVTSQNPQANTQAPEGSTVTIRVGSLRVIGTVGTPTGGIATVRIQAPTGVATLRIATERLRTLQTP